MAKRTSACAALLMVAALLTACATEDPDSATPKDSGAGGVEAQAPTGPITFISGFDPGGGIDLAVNSMTAALKGGDIVSVPMRLDHIPGGSGLIAASTLVADNRGDADIMQVATLSSMAATVRQGEDKVGLLDMTPIAGLFSEFTYVYVKADSKFQTLKDLVDAVKANPKKVRISGGSLGSADSLTVAQLAGVLGLGFSDMTYIPLEGGEGTTGVLGGHVESHFGGPDLMNLVESGELRVLAVSAGERLTGAKVSEIPTFKESGYDVVQANWRGLVGPPDMPAGAVAYWEDAISKMVETAEWKASMEKNVWGNTYVDSKGFTEFLSQQKAELTETLTSLGLVE